MTNVQKKRQAQAECIIAQFIPLTDNPHDTRHKAVQRYQRTFYTRAIAAAQRRGLNLALAHKLTLQRLIPSGLNPARRENMAICTTG